MLCYYAEGHNADCGILFTILKNVDMLSVIMLNVVMLSVIMLNVVTLSVIAPVLRFTFNLGELYYIFCSLVTALFSL
jgi:hypothetical protein